MAKKTASAVQHRYSIGVIYGGDGPEQAEIIDGILACAADRDLDIFIFDAGALDEADEGGTGRGAFLNLINKRLIDGLIVLPGTFSRMTERLRRQAYKRFHPLPLVTAGFRLTGAAGVTADTQTAMNELVAHLADAHGRKRIAFITSRAASDERLKEYRAALKKHGLPFRAGLTIVADERTAGSRRAFTRFCAGAGKAFDAVAAGDGLAAARLMEAAVRQGVRVPEECAIVAGETGRTVAVLPLTAMVIDQQAVGRSAADLLVSLLTGNADNGHPPPPVPVAYRASCGCSDRSAASPIMTRGRRPAVRNTARDRNDLRAKIAALHPEFPRAVRPVLEARVRDMLDRLAESGDGSGTGAYLALAWNGLIAALLVCGAPLLPWLAVLELLEEWRRPYAATRLSDFFSAARRALIDARDATRGVFHGANERLVACEQKLLRATDLNAIRAVIAADLPELGYASFFFSLSAGENQPLHYSRLEAGRLAGVAVKAGTKRAPFLTNRLLPGGLENRKHRQAWCVEALFDRDRFLGLLLLSAARPDIKMNERLRRGLCGALVRALRLRALDGENTNLKTQVSSQADALHTAGQRIQKEKRASERLHEELKKSETRYRRWFEEDFTGNFIAAANGDIINCNSAFARMFGYQSATEALGANFGDFYPNKSALEDFYTLLGVVKRIAYYETEFVRKDGSLLHIIGNIIGTFDEEHNLVEMQGFLFDNTERKRLEDELRHAHKMDAIGRLAGGIAHDFNNILTGIMGYSELLLHKIPKSDPSQRDVEEIKKAAKSAASLTRQLLAFSRKQILQPLLLDLNDVVASMRDLLNRIIGEHITLVTELDRELKPVKADRGQVEQVIMNLVINARDALPHGGTVVITTRNRLIESTAEFTASVDIKPGPYVVLEVTDNGVGMDLETQSHIFEPFFSTKKTGQGVGLGLSTVYGIVTQSGGFPEVLSEPHRGTTMRIYLPQYLQAVAMPEERIQYEEEVRGDETILLVEDEGFVRELAEKVLTHEGYHVIAAHNAQEALSLVKRLSLDIDLVVTDVVMPGISGVELGQKIQAMRPEVKVLYMSGYDDKMLQQQGEHGISFNFIQKPFTPDVFLRKVQEVLNR